MGVGGPRTKPGVLAGPVKAYKALVVAHDLFMAGWDAVVWGSWSLCSSWLLPLLHNTQTGDGNGNKALKHCKQIRWHGLYSASPCLSQKEKVWAFFLKLGNEAKKRRVT